MEGSTVKYLLKTTMREWLDDNCLRLGAALSYYTVFSLAPLLIIVIAIAGLAFGNDYARVQILKQLEGLLGPQGTAAAGEMLQNASKPRTGMIATILGIITMLFGATGVVTELKGALNTIWDLDSSEGIKGAVKDRARALGMVLAIGFLLLVSLVISAVLTAISRSYGTAGFLEVMNFIVSTGVITVLFAMIFKYLPDTEVKWRNVWLGSFVTAILFTIGKTLTAFYIAKSSIASGYGAAGSLVIILLWVYYNSQILFLGAEFTEVYSREKGDAPRAFVTEEPEEKLEQQGGGHGSSSSKRYTEAEIRQEEPVSKESVTLDGKSPIEKVAFITGYKLEKLEQAGKKIKRKAKLGKWALKIVQLLGVKGSAKLGWKGYKLKKKLENKNEAA